MPALSPSRYNFAVAAKGDDGQPVAIFNAYSGALQVLRGAHSVSLGDALLDPSVGFTGSEFDAALLSDLLRGRFLIPHGHDEIADVRARYWRARQDTPVVITITTTMDCNLGCYYCYEERSGARLEEASVPALVDFVGQRLGHRPGRNALHVDWYGGEPLLNVAFVEAASAALRSYCRDAGVKYVASVITNGSCWPDNPAEFIQRHAIKQVQVSFDGLREHHDKRRRYRKGYRPEVGASSFDRAVALVDALVDCVRVDLRFNLDAGNQTDLLPFIDFAESRGWFAARYPAVFQPARLAAYSPKSRFLRDVELPLAAFDALRADARRHIADKAAIEESEVPDGFPFPKFSVCAALAHDSAVIGADGLLYRCGLQVGERGRAVGRISPSEGDPSIDRAVGADQPWWDTFDPTRQPTCSACSFLPICWGGCPKKHLEGDQHALREQGRYWRTNLPRQIATAARFTVVVPEAFPETLQFR